MNEQLPKRKQIRIKDYDYSQSGYYFVTVCTHDRKNILSAIVGADDPVRPYDTIYPDVKLTEIGNIVKSCWENINQIYDNVRTDTFVIMPNHIHGIIVIGDHDADKAGGQSRPPLPKIMQGFKSITTRMCYKLGYKKIWQKSYYEHIIRNEEDYLKTSEYIINNPLNWETDKEIMT